MKELAAMMFNPYVLAYLATIGGVQLAYYGYRQRRAARIRQQRKAVDLPADILVNHADTLSDQRRQALITGGLFLFTLVVVPVLLVAIDRCTGGALAPQAKNGLAGTFLALLAWLLYNGTDVARSTLGGAAFKTLLAFKHPIQIGDRVSIKGVSGKVVSCDSFFVQLDTVNDDRISIPTHTLWGEVLTSANAGARSSLCVMPFHLSPQASSQQRQQAENAIWDAIQSSAFYEPAKPMQIYLSQTPYSIELTAKAYVASTYNEALFTSDVTQAFLDFAAEHELPLAQTPVLPQTAGSAP